MIYVGTIRGLMLILRMRAEREQQQRISLMVRHARKCDEQYNLATNELDTIIAQDNS